MPALALKHEDRQRLHFASRRVVAWGFLMIGTPLAFVPSAVPPGHGPAPYLIGGGGVFFALIGLFGVLHRYNLTIDMTTRTYQGARGFWPFPKPMRGKLDDMRGVVLERHWSTRSDSRGGTKRFVTWILKFDFGGGDEVGFFATTIERQAYNKLEHYAKLLRLPAVDRTHDGAVRSRQHPQLDHSLAERAWAGEEQVGEPGSPPGTDRIMWDPTHGAASIRLPPLGLAVDRLLFLLLTLISTAVGSAVALAQLGHVELPVRIHSGGWLFAAFFLLFGLGGFFQTLTVIRGREIIREQRDGLRFEWTTGLGRRRRWPRRFVPKRAIEEIGIQQVADDATRRLRLRQRLEPEQVAVRTDDRIVRVGASLTAEEQRWLVGALKHLAAR